MSRDDSDENFVIHDIRSTSKRSKLGKEVFTCLDDSDENFVIYDTRSTSKRIKPGKEFFTGLDDCINNNFNYESMQSRLVSHSKNSVEKNTSEDLIPIVFGTIVLNVPKCTNNENLENKALANKKNSSHPTR